MGWVGLAPNLSCWHGQTFKESESKTKDLQERLNAALREKEVLEGRVREVEMEQAAKREAVGVGLLKLVCRVGYWRELEGITVPCVHPGVEDKGG